MPKTGSLLIAKIPLPAADARASRRIAATIGFPPTATRSQYDRLARFGSPVDRSSKRIAWLGLALITVACLVFAGVDLYRLSGPPGGMSPDRELALRIIGYIASVGRNRD